MRVWMRWVLLVAALAAVSAMLHWTVMRPPPVPVDVYVVDCGVVEETVTNTRAGTVRARRNARVSAETSGRVVAIPRREGAAVAAGEVLVELDSTEAREILALAERELASAEALVAEAQANLDDVARELERTERLVPSGAVSPEQVDRLRSRREALAAQLAAAWARVRQQQKAVDLARVRLERCFVRAPFDGVVAERHIEVSEWAVAGQPLVRLIDPSDLYVEVEIDEVDIVHVRPGLTARVTLDPMRDRGFAGRVVRVAPMVSDTERQNRTLRVEIAFEEEPPETIAKPGVSADAEIILRRLEQVLRVPTHAVVRDRYVLVVNEGHAVRREVQLGLRNWQFAEIREGLREGDRVILSLDRQEVREGARVAPRSG